MFFAITPEMRQALAEYLGDQQQMSTESDLEELRATYQTQEAALGHAGWDDPSMNVYDDNEPRS